jgi:hypothetical protein
MNHPSRLPLSPDERRRRALTGGPQLECRSCRLPILLSFVVRNGASRSIDCPLCDHHDEWTVVDAR